MATIKINYKKHAKTFWDHVWVAADAPTELKNISGDIVVTDERAREIAAWCRSVPGFSDCPDFAQDALLFQPRIKR